MKIVGEGALAVSPRHDFFKDLSGFMSAIFWKGGRFRAGGSFAGVHVDGGCLYIM